MAFTPGKGTTISLGGSAIAQVTAITPPGLTMGTSETTHLTSTWRTCIANIRDGGECGFTIEWDSADVSHAAVLTDFGAGTSGTWLITFTDSGATTIGFSGIVTGFAPDEVVVDNIVTAQLTIKINGAVTITP
jgi:hypothetical protein